MLSTAKHLARLVGRMELLALVKSLVQKLIGSFASRRFAVGVDGDFTMA